MNWLDDTLIALLVLGTISGLISGPLWQVYRTLAVIISVAVSLVFHTIARSVFQGLFDHKAANISAYAVVFFAALMLTYVLGSIFKSVLTTRKFGFGGRVLGGGVALLKTIILCCIFISGISYMGNKRTDTMIEDSTIAKNFNEVSRTVVSKFPAEIKGFSFRKDTDNIEDSW
ncbi:MAG: CvpA family protein [Candidatus Scalindua sp.]|nr:CvpA family protein [Candidatus Scalindua sp.]